MLETFFWYLKTGGENNQKISNAIQNMRLNFALTQQYKFPDKYTKDIIDELMQEVLPSNLKLYDRSMNYSVGCSKRSLLEKQHFELDRLPSNLSEKL
jgi:hypothetical protein